MELKPCPFCGSSNIEYYIKEPEVGISLSMIECQICFARTMEYRNVTSEEMIGIWNHRVPDWTSVKDYLSEMLEDVWLYSTKYECHYKGYYNGKNNIGERIWIDDSGRIFGDDTITHWMPLPEPPKDE